MRRRSETGAGPGNPFSHADASGCVGARTAFLPEGGVTVILRAMLNARFLILLSLCGAWLGGVPGVRAQVKPEAPPATEKIKNWGVDSRGRIKAPEFGMPTALALDVGLSPDAQGREDGGGKMMSLKKSDYASDRTLTAASTDSQGRTVFEMAQSMKVSQRLNEGFRLLDMLRMNLTKDASMQVRYRTEFDDKMTARQIPTVAGEKGSVAMLLVPKVKGRPVVVLMMGGVDEGWTRRIDAGEDYVSWSYSGKVKASQELCFLHRVAFSSNDSPEKVEEAVRALVADGMPADESLTAAVHQQLVNYPVTLKTPPPSSGAASLVFLAQALDELKLKRSGEEDLLRMDGSKNVPGSFDVTACRLSGQELKQEEIAAIFSGNGTRESRVFMRDGRVLRGVLEWQEATFESEELGSIRLSAGSPGVVVLRHEEGDGQMTGTPVAWMADAADGQVLPVMAFPEEPLRFRWLGGHLTSPWTTVLDLRALPGPSLEQELRLRDGSQMRGWLETGPDATAPAAFWARDLPALRALMLDKAPVPSAPGGSHLRLTDGSVLPGGPDSRTAAAFSGESLTHFKLADLESLERQADGQEEHLAPRFEVTMKSGARLTAMPHGSMLRWQHGGQTMTLPWLWVQSARLMPDREAKQP